MLPWDVNLALNYLGRQGFPFPQSILTPNRANGGGTAQVLLDPLGDVRLTTCTRSTSASTVRSASARSRSSRPSTCST